MKLLLASKSATRRRMLEAAGVPFESVEADFDEEGAKESLAGLAALDLALALAERKALAARTAGDALVLGSDQSLELEDGTILGKLPSLDDSRRQLMRMSGRPHRLHSAAAIAEHGTIVWRATESVTLHVRPLGEGSVSDYLAREYEAVRWNVGGYRIEGLGIQLFDRIEGSHFAILGLPLLPLLAYLRERELLPS